MDMFRADRLTKCRTRSISPISGNGGGAEARADAGSKSFAAATGTSHSGSPCVRRPARLSSHKSWVDWLFCMELPHFRCKSCCEAVDLGAGAPLRDGDGDAVGEFWVPAAERQAGVVAGFQQTGKQFRRIAFKGQRK